MNLVEIKDLYVCRVDQTKDAFHHFAIVLVVEYQSFGAMKPQDHHHTYH